nr:polymorphic toxin-type HINT domain-containing protein [Polyangiaceae bacterium]
LAMRAAYDAAGRLVEKTDPEGHAATYAYDGRGRRTLAKDPDQGEHRFAYDAAGDLAEHRRPDGSVRRWTYDLAGREATQDWDGDGVPEVEKTWGDEPGSGAGPLGAGKLVRVRDPSGSVENDYDERGRVVKTRHAIEGAVYATESDYDDQDREYWHTYPDGSSVRIERNARGQLAGYGEGALRVAYDGDGVELGRTYATGVTEVQGYDEDRRRSAYAVRAPDGTPLVALRWGYDGAGNLTGVVDERSGVDAGRDRTASYAYDNLYRLTEMRVAAGTTRWAYSPSGNLVERTSQDPAQNAGRMTYGEGAGPHALTGVGTRRLAYDALGRMTSDGERVYTWNAADRLTRVTHASGASVESVYDGEGVRRVRVERAPDGSDVRTHLLDLWSEVEGGRLVRYLVHEGRRVVRLADANGTKAVGIPLDARPEGNDTATISPALAALATKAPALLLAAVLLVVLAHRERRRLRRWAPAFALAILAFGCGAGTQDAGPPPLREGSVKTLSDADTLLFSDQVGSLAETTSGTGAPRGSFAAQPFGPARWDTTSESRPYAGGVRDRGVGLDVMGLRALAPDLGVWTSPDPEALASPDRGLGDALTANNPYAYASQTPLVARDEDGQWAQIAIGAGVGAAIGGGLEAYRQYREHGRIESWGKVAGQAGIGAVAGAVAATAGPQAGLATVAAWGAGTGAASGVASRLVESGGRDAGSFRDALTDAAVGAGTAGLGYGAGKAVSAALPAVKRALGSVGSKAMARGCAGGSCACFVAGTPVWTDKGLVPIDSIQVGDWALTRDETTGAWVWRRVLQTFVTPDKPVLALTLQDELGRRDVLRVTAEHPFKTQGLGWMPAGELRVGDRVLNANDTSLRVEQATWAPGRQTVYNLEVEEDHTYVVGQLGAWVHNTCNPNELLALAEKVQLAGKMPRWHQTVSVLKTAEGKLLVGAGRSDLNEAQIAAAKNLGLMPTALKKAHAEQTVLQAARDMKLTPQVGAATNNVCSGICQPLIVDTLKGWTNGKFYGF